MSSLLKATEVQQRYNISRTTLHRRIKSNQIPAPVKINGQNYWSAEAINEHMNSVIGGAAR
jgi:predicted DNA-binding transcriptional regulator AlpA